MSAVHLSAHIHRLTIPVTALAAIGAELRLRLDASAGDPATRPLLRQVARAIDPALLEDVSEAQMHAALGSIRAALLEALALLDEPARAPGWQPQDTDVAAALGIGSRARVAAIEAIAATRPDMADMLRRPGTFLDVGTGTGSLAITAARQWPALEVLGIDIWPPSLALAHAALATSGVAHRVELRHQDVLDLPERDAVSLAWVPTPFLPAAVLERALPVLRAALLPGGWLVLGLLRIPGDPLGEAAAKLRVVRTGGHPWQPYQLAALLEQHGFTDVEMLEQPSGTSHVIGRRPESASAPA